MREHHNGLLRECVARFGDYCDPRYIEHSVREFVNPRNLWAGTLAKNFLNDLKHSRRNLLRRLIYVKGDPFGHDPDYCSQNNDHERHRGKPEAQR